MKQKMVLSLLMPVLMTALAAGSCESSKQEGPMTSDPTAATPSIMPATASATDEEDIDGVIRQLFWDYERVKDVTIEGKTNYVDSSGTEWIRFDAHMGDEICRAGPQPGPAGAVSGLMKKVPGGNWELINLGVGDVQCGVPADVQTGLGFATCPASEEELNEAIENYLLTGPARSRKHTDVKIVRKAYYTDSSGTNWAEFCILGIPNLTGPTYGFMKKVAGGNWEGVNFGSGAVECGLPEDVQTGLGFAYCEHG